MDLEATSQQPVIKIRSRGAPDRQRVRTQYLLLHAPVMDRYFFARQVSGHLGGSMKGKHPDRLAMVPRRSAGRASTEQDRPECV